MKILGSLSGANLKGYFVNSAFTPTTGTNSCGPGSTPAYVMTWFPSSSDSTPWFATVVSRNFPYFGVPAVAGVDQLDLGIASSISSFDFTKRDGLSLPNPAAVQALAVPQGSVGLYCAPYGTVSITANQVASPHRPGQFIMTTVDGCGAFAVLDKLVLTGSESEKGGLAYAVFGAWGRSNGTVYQTPDASTAGICTYPVLDVKNALTGWAGCTARGGTRVNLVYVGIGVYHSSDVSYRVESFDASGTRRPTLMSGPPPGQAGGYAPYENAVEQWCMTPGPYIINVYDNNVVSAANFSRGWDSGNIFVTDAAGCIIVTASVSASDAYGSADIHAVQKEFLVPKEGQCLLPGPWDGFGMNLSAASAATDFGESETFCCA